MGVKIAAVHRTSLWGLNKIIGRGMHTQFATPCMHVLLVCTVTMALCSRPRQKALQPAEASSQPNPSAAASPAAARTVHPRFEALAAAPALHRRKHRVRHHVGVSQDEAIGDGKAAAAALRLALELQRRRGRPGGGRRAAGLSGGASRLATGKLRAGCVHPLSCKDSPGTQASSAAPRRCRPFRTLWDSAHRLLACQGW